MFRSVRLGRVDVGLNLASVDDVLCLPTFPFGVCICMRLCVLAWQVRVHPPGRCIAEMKNEELYDMFSRDLENAQSYVRITVCTINSSPISMTHAELVV